MNVTFELAFDRTLGNEGGYVFNSHDPGGETQWGISKRAYPTLDIKTLTKDDAKAIYLRDFWNDCGQSLPDAVKYQVFDAAVNHGIGNAVRMLQRAVGAVDDGHWGMVSNSLLKQHDTSDVLMLFLAERGEFMTKLVAFNTFGRGWTRRICTNLRYAATDT